MVTGAGRETETTETKGMVKTKLRNGEKVVSLVKAALGEGQMVEEATCQVVVLIPKGGGETIVA